MRFDEAVAALERLGDPARAALLQRYFRTGPGEYGEGDAFLGVTVPQVRAVAGRGAAMADADLQRLLDSPVHEHRLAALLSMVAEFAKADESRRGELYRLYLENTARINNWDLVDCSAGHIVGAWLSLRERGPLRRLARSSLVWERRIAIMATFAFIRRGETAETYRIAEMLLDDDHDLVHKAAGWMLREAGKRGDLAGEEEFLRRHLGRMPRTMLRYAIERFPEAKRRRYLAGRP